MESTWIMKSGEGKYHHKIMLRDGDYCPLIADVHAGEYIASLISTAPELLIMLRRLYDATYGKTDLICPLDFEQARAIMDKAEGVRHE